ncbi:unnamed protein product [Caenorhabditis auriculariae]|uniref:Uncharacterized protein n=1 Tax=Caenorhabditis auriculariae TaxID=2777116 RepID=A0A8S1GM63_9PELO|nr:unnamed protein product [Caenorhabditis auriculariae]
MPTNKAPSTTNGVPNIRINSRKRKNDDVVHFKKRPIVELHSCSPTSSNKENDDEKEMEIEEKISTTDGSSLNAEDFLALLFEAEQRFTSKNARTKAMLNTGMRPFFVVEFNWLNSWDYGSYDIVSDMTSLAVVYAKVGLFDDSGKVSLHDLGFALIPKSKNWEREESLKRLYNEKNKTLLSFRAFSCLKKEIKNSRHVFLYVKVKRFVPKQAIENENVRLKRFKAAVNSLEKVEYSEVVRYGCRKIGHMAMDELDFLSSVQHLLLHDPKNFSLKDVSLTDEKWMQKLEVATRIDSLNVDKNEGNSFSARMIFSVGDTRISSEEKVSRVRRSPRKNRSSEILPRKSPKSNDFESYHFVQEKRACPLTSDELDRKTSVNCCPFTKQRFESNKFLQIHLKRRYPMFSFRPSERANCFNATADSDFNFSQEKKDSWIFMKVKKRMGVLRSRFPVDVAPEPCGNFPRDHHLTYIQSSYLLKPYPPNAGGWATVSVEKPAVVLSQPLLKCHKHLNCHLVRYNIIFISYMLGNGYRQASRSPEQLHELYKEYVKKPRLNGLLLKT